MSNSLQSGVSGLRAHQRMLEVVGSNLANLNTTAYKGAKAVFADQLSQTLGAGTRPGASETQGAQGGVNPSQSGLGVTVAGVEVDTTQGSFQNTGRALDLAIEGNGFFVVQDGIQKAYTRAGNMDIDSAGFLTHTTSGMRVLSSSNQDIQISNRDIPAATTTQMTLSGNLSADARPPLAEVQTSLTSYDTRASVTSGNVEPYNMATGPVDFAIQIGTGAPQTVSITPGAALTASQIATEINTQTSGVRAFSENGALRIQSSASGAVSGFTLTDGANTPLATMGVAIGAQTGGVPTSATPLNDLGSNLTPYAAGDVIGINGRDDGAVIDPPLQFVYGTGPGQHGTTLGDLVARANLGYADATLTLGTDGDMMLTAGGVGDRDYALTFGDGVGNTGASNLAQHTLVVTTDGFDGDEVQTSVEIFDSLGDSHTLDLTFSYQGGNLWDLAATSSETGVSVDSGTINGLTFSTTGEFANVQSTPVLQLSFDPALGNLVDDMTVELSFGTPGEGDGMTMFSGTSAASVTEQDGNAPGRLTSISVDKDGTILGVYDNGERQELDQIKLVTFANPGGLLRAGGNLWQLSPNSGTESTLSPGGIVSGVLEGSNVDTAQEFTRLIQAQRGFQVNARTITTTDQILQELANLIR